MGVSGVLITSNNSNAWGGTTNYTEPNLTSTTSIVLTAPLNPPIGSSMVFSNWVGCNSTNPTTRTCNVTMSTDKTVIANYIPNQGTLIIQKWATNNNATFNYTVTNPGSNSIAVSTNGGYGQNGSGKSLTAATTYSVMETVLAGSGWSLTSRSCTKQDGSSNGTASCNGVTGVQIIAGQTTFCEFHNLYSAVNNPVPNITSLSPNPVTVYGNGFSLQVNGTNFVNGIVGRVGGAARTTTYVSPTRFLMQMLSSDIAAIGQRMIQGVNPGPGGGAGNMMALNVVKASPTITTIIKNSNNVATNNIISGQFAYDTATLQNATPNAGGTVTYTVFTNNTCTTCAFYATGGVKNFFNGAVGNSNNITFPTAGTFYWEAYYSGDANNNFSRSPCTAEVFTVSSPAPTLRLRKSVIGGGPATA